MTRASWLLAFALLMCGTSNAANAADDPSVPLPTQAFFRNADLGTVRLSPSGRWLAAGVRSKDDRVALAVLDLDKKEQPTVVAAYSDADVRSFDWVNDERLVYNVIDFQSGNAEQKFGPGLWSVNRNGLDRRLLVYPRQQFVVRDAGSSLVRPLSSNHQLLAVPGTGGNEVVVGEYRYDGIGDFVSINPLFLDVTTGRTRSLAVGAPDHARQWFFDPKGQPRAVVTQFRGEREILWRDDASAPWRSLKKFATYSDGFSPVAVDGAGQLFVTTGSASGNSVLRRYDFAKGKAEPQPLVSAEGFDFDGRLLMDDAGSRALGVRFETDAEVTIWFDADLKKLQGIADARFPGRINRLTCRGCASGGVLLVYSYSDQDPGSYWLYRPASDEWEPIGKTRPAIDPARMAQVDFFRIKARDGEVMPIWVTTPPGKASKPRAAVVLVHGGPWVRGGHWRWNREAQFLASRGFVVIEPEFRGSTGYGYAHFERGFKQWGGTMQDDLADAVGWAATSGKIDASRVCIAGASYGGYATLMSLVRYPDLYKCGVAWAAVTDPRLRYEESWRSDADEEVRKYSLPTLVGDPVKDAELLKAAAPVLHADKIRAPVYLAFGREDRRVPLEHGTTMREALRAAGNEPEWTVYDGEGHGWLRLDHNVDFYDHMARFLSQNLR